MGEFDLLSSDAQTKLTEFDESVMRALAGAPDPWAARLARRVNSAAFKTNFPFAIGTPGFKKLEGEMRYRRLSHKSLEIATEVYQDGVEELASVVEAPDFIGWGDEPKAIALKGVGLPNRIVRDLLSANPTGWDGVAFFHAAHPQNPLASGGTTFQNVTASRALNSTNLPLAKKDFRKIKDPSGESMGMRLTHILVPGALEETALDLTERKLVLESKGSSEFGQVENRHYKTVEVIVCDELDALSETTWYGLSLGVPGMYPWVLKEQGAVETIIQDKTSHLYKNTLKVAYSAIWRGDAKLFMPHCIHKYTA